MLNLIFATIGFLVVGTAVVWAATFVVVYYRAMMEPRPPLTDADVTREAIRLVEGRRGRAA